MNGVERGWWAIAAEIYEKILQAFSEDADPAIAGILQRARKVLGKDWPS